MLRGDDWPRQWTFLMEVESALCNYVAPGLTRWMVLAHGMSGWHYMPSVRFIRRMSAERWAAGATEMAPPGLVDFEVREVSRVSPRCLRCGEVFASVKELLDHVRKVHARVQDGDSGCSE